mmetsp:Transcript_27707/g.45035  ORF Transcript_27707/g.45035 Transcript_27707/m.45035 type:complete len:103 (-) Transcript_27707:1217-1525(-)
MMATEWGAKGRQGSSLVQRASAIKERAIGTDPPVVPLQVQFLKKSKTVRRRYNRRTMFLVIASVLLLLASALAVSIFYAKCVCTYPRYILNAWMIWVDYHYD